MITCTPQERRALAFVIGLMLAGSAIRHLCKAYAPLTTVACVQPNLGKVCLNTADSQTLEILPGVGRKLAGRIVDFRLRHGNFSDVSDLALVKGVSARAVDRLRSLVYIE